MSDNANDDLNKEKTDDVQNEQAQAQGHEQNSAQPENNEPEATSSENQAQETPAEAEESHESTIEKLKHALESAEAKVKDEMLRAQAEIQNIRKRAERDIESAHKFGQEKLVKELLMVVDTLERGVHSMNEHEGELEGPAKILKDGSELTLKMFLDTLSKFDVKVVDPVGEPFDPQFHEAMSMIEHPDAEPNSVVEVIQKGFTLHDRLVRPAMVIVSKG